jgi:hypothetical protein
VEGLIAALNATGEAALGLAEARQTSNSCRDALALLRSTVDTFELALATDQALEPDAPPVAAAAAELLRMRATHDRWGRCCAAAGGCAFSQRELTRLTAAPHWAPGSVPRLETQVWWRSRRPETQRPRR